MNFKYKKPQMNADERRYTRVTGFEDFPIGRGFPVTESVEIAHRKGLKECKAMQQESLRPLRSLRLNAFSTPAHERAPPAPAVHSPFLNMIIFRATVEGMN